MSYEDKFSQYLDRCITNRQEDLEKARDRLNLAKVDIVVAENALDVTKAIKHAYVQGKMTADQDGNTRF